MLYSEVLAGVSLPAGMDTLILLGGTGYVMLGNSHFYPVHVQMNGMEREESPIHLKMLHVGLFF